MGSGGATLDVACPADPQEALPGEWVCEHRDPALLAMVEFRRVVTGTSVEAWWDNGSDAVAFTRGSRGFVALNLESTPVSLELQTDLPEGTYCDILDGGVAEAGCVGGLVAVWPSTRTWTCFSAAMAPAMRESWSRPSWLS